MQSLQFIGLIALVFLAYKYLYLPYSNRKKEEAEELERKIGILSSIQKDMRELFDPYINYTSHKSEDDEYHIEYGGWIRLYGRTLHFSSDSELNDFKEKALNLYKSLNNDPTKKAQIERIFKEESQRQTEYNRNKEIKFLALKKNFLEYDVILNELMPDYKISHTKKEIVSFLEKKLSKSNADAEIIFNSLTDKTTRILSQAYHNGWQDKYCYYGEIDLKNKIERL